MDMDMDMEKKERGGRGPEPRTRADESGAARGLQCTESGSGRTFREEFLSL